MQSNWRLGVENGFDASHIFIHKGSPLCAGANIALPLGFAPTQPGVGTRESVASPGPIGLYDLLGESAIPVFEGTIEGETVLEGHFGERRVADNISIWLPGVLKVDPWPQEDMQQFEWYVPVDASSHIYLQTLGKLTDSAAAAEAFRKEVDEKWIALALDGFNDDDVWAREATEEFYADQDRGWVEERLFEADIAIVEWRRLASKHNRGIQRPQNL